MGSQDAESEVKQLREEFFRRLRDRTGIEMLLTKGEIHRLVNPRTLTIYQEKSRQLDLIAEPVSESGCNAGRIESAELRAGLANSHCPPASSGVTGLQRQPAEHPSR